MKNYSTTFLKTAIVLISLPVIAIAVFLLPQVVVRAFQELTNGPTLAYTVLGILAIVYLSIIPFLMALYQGFKLLRYIDRKQAFSDLSVQSLRKIKRCGWVIAGLYALALPFIYVIAEWDDAPGLILFGMLIAGAAIVVAVFANVMEKLFEEAMRLKNENELTV